MDAFGRRLLDTTALRRHHGRQCSSALFARRRMQRGRTTEMSGHFNRPDACTARAERSTPPSGVLPMPMIYACRGPIDRAVSRSTYRTNRQNVTELNDTDEAEPAVSLTAAERRTGASGATWSLALSPRDVVVPISRMMTNRCASENAISKCMKRNRFARTHARTHAHTHTHIYEHSEMGSFRTFVEL